MRGRPPADTALCGFDRTGRQTQRAKSSGPFEMSRQEAGQRKARTLPSHWSLEAARLVVVPASGAQRIRPPGPGCQLRAPPHESKGWARPSPSAAGVCRAEQTSRPTGSTPGTVAQHDLEVKAGTVGASGPRLRASMGHALNMAQPPRGVESGGLGGLAQLSSASQHLALGPETSYSVSQCPHLYNGANSIGAVPVSQVIPGCR